MPCPPSSLTTSEARLDFNQIILVDDFGGQDAGILANVTTPEVNSVEEPACSESRLIMIRTYNPNEEMIARINRIVESTKYDHEVKIVH